MRIAATGFVDEGAGSVASANALLLRALLDLGCEIDFFSKARFVDPRPAVEARKNFCFHDTDNRMADRLREASQRVPGLAQATRLWDVRSYNRLLVREQTALHARKPFAVSLWLGDYARGRVPGVPVVSFVQGPPGTDARSILRRFEEIRELAGLVTAWRWRLLARLRLSRVGLPPFRNSDHFLVGSNQSRQTLRDLFGVPFARSTAVPYAIDLDLFQPSVTDREPGPLRVLWLGRIVPRKRLDLFLAGASAALARGVDLRLTVVGRVGLVRGYGKLLGNFPQPSVLQWHESAPRSAVPDLLRAHDVLVQPSEEEDFGSAVAEAQSCGLAVITGRTNGNADYLGPRDVHLADDDPATLAAALEQVARQAGCDRGVSRAFAEATYNPARIARMVVEVLQEVAARKEGSP